MPHPEDRAWWTDVQHLRPEARAAAAAAAGQPAAGQPADNQPAAAPAADDRADARTRPPAGRSESARRTGPTTPERPARRRAAASTERLTRSDAAGFAAAFDHDGDWGRPQARSMTIVLERTPADVDAEAVELEDEDWLEERRDARLPARGGALQPAAVRDLPAVARRPDRLDALSDELTGASSQTSAGPSATDVVRRAAGEPVAAARGTLPRAARTRRLTPRPQLTPVERLTQRPDRIALWAVALGVLLIVIAAFSGNAQAASTSPAGPGTAAQTRVVVPPAAPAAPVAARR